MSNQSKEIRTFGNFRLDRREALLTRDGAAVPLPPKVFDLLVYLVGNAGRLIEKEELLKAIWPDSFVEESNLTVNIAALRKALGAQTDGQPWIETVPKRGYRFVAAVSCAAVVEANAAPGSVVEESASAVAPAAAVVAPESSPTSSMPLIWRVCGKYLIVAAFVVLAAVGVSWYLKVHGQSTSPRREQTIAVLPFQDIAPQPDNPHVGLGMADALITRLATLPLLNVRPIATVTKYESGGVDPIEAGHSVGADTVLSGSVQRLDKKIRVSVLLVRVQDGQSLWVGKFDEFFTNIFAVQDAISEKIASVLALRLTSEEQDRMMRRYTENTEAYRLYELGRYTRLSDPLASRDFLQKAVREDPHYALPYVELANIWAGVSGNGASAFREYAPLAREAAANALRLAPDLAEAHVAAADVKRTVDRDFQGAARELEIAVRLNPGSPKVHASRSVLLAMQGDLAVALQEAHTAMRLDPFNGQYAGDLAWIMYCNHQCEEAVQFLDDFDRLDPRPYVDWNRFYCYMKMSRAGEAIMMLEAELQRKPSNDALKAVLAHAYAVAGKSREARDVLKSLRQDWGYYQRAVVELTLGDRDAALAHFDQAVDEHSVWVPWLKVDPDTEPLRGDPRFRRIVERVGLTP
ncbi:MAG TPA: winged helix-turn-helix domain-containing protein [Bryobacteraceae bacterium]|nr:winged helix-turn-helix domain-containing protein [Bryobacteraceae bacterium]